MASSLDDDPVLISALNHFACCPRRCALIHMDREFEDNVHTARGSAEHEQADGDAHVAGRDGARLEYSLTVWSERIGLSGRCGECSMNAVRQPEIAAARGRLKALRDCLFTVAGASGVSERW
jgi:hypothetical protein